MKKERGRNQNGAGAALQETMPRWRSKHEDLWARIAAFEFDDGIVTFSFVQRLGRENGWSLQYSIRVLREYRRFTFLAIAAGHGVTPSDQVDQAWHLHLLYTDSYWNRFCHLALERPLHHSPTTGGSIEEAKFHSSYAATMASYRQFFGNEPPADIWPDPSTRFGVDVHGQRINPRRVWVIQKRDALLVAMTTVGLLLGAAILAVC